MGRDPQAGLGRAAERRAIAPDRATFGRGPPQKGIWKRHIANCHSDNGELQNFRARNEFNAMFGPVNF